ncbi:sulfoquinovosidase-like [Panulirus ornatus]|uniref:sulfoquinovosidase-like n=1 Tax=Panulirus ornatus TaxID=150431 RepID=UPI003A867D79
MAETKVRSLGTFLLLLFLTATLTTAELSLVYNEDGFFISVYGREVFRHTEDDPIIWIGHGRSNFSEQHGNFEIEDEVLVRRPLQRYEEISDLPDYIHLAFSSSEDSSLTVELAIRETPGTGGHSLVNLSTYTNTTYSRMWVRLSAEEAERVWGAGEQYTYLNLRGHAFPIWTSEQGVGRDGGIISNISDIDGGAGGEYYTTYWPQASFLSSKRYSLLILDHNYLVLNFTEATRHEVYLHSNTFQAILVVGPSLLKTVQAVTTSLGTQPLLPDWIITGATLGVQRGTEEMMAHYEQAKEAGVNVSALWIQDWSGTTETIFGHRVYWNWRWNQTFYPDLDTTIQELSEDDVRVMVYINPHLIDSGDMFEAAAILGFLMTDADGEVFRQDFGGFMAGTVDLLNPEARTWYREEMIRNMVEMGLGGWMADFGEYTRMDMFSANTEHSGEVRHNLLPVEWAKCNREVLEFTGQLGNVVPFMRSGGLGSSTHQILAWAGDQNVDWSLADGVASTIVAALSLGLSGMGVTHFDIGGYTTQPPVLKRSKELLLRSAEYAVFTPVMRTHEGNKPTANHQFYSDEDTLTQFARLTQIHARLLPYTRYLLEDLATTGTPVQRPLFLDFEDDAGAWDVIYQYMYGPDLLVAPIIHKDQMTQTVYLPAGESYWQHLWDHAGGVVMGPANVTVAAPLGYPAVFYRQLSPWQKLFREIRQEFGY